MGSYEFKCPDDVIECQTTHRCWGWFKTHTYKSFKELTGKDTLTITKIEYSVDMGMHENPLPLSGVLQLKTPDDKWVTVASFSVPGSAYYKDFSISFSTPKKATQIRFKATSPNSFIDGSKVKIYTKEETPPDDGNGGDDNGDNENNEWWKNIDIKKILIGIGIIVAIFLLWKYLK